MPVEHGVGSFSLPFRHQSILAGDLREQKRAAALRLDIPIRALVDVFLWMVELDVFELE